MQKHDTYADKDDFVDEIGREIALLESRLEDGPPVPDSDDDKEW